VNSTYRRLNGVVPRRDCISRNEKGGLSREPAFVTGTVIANISIWGGQTERLDPGTDEFLGNIAVPRARMQLALPLD
jgi:hypothetical protein